MITSNVVTATLMSILAISSFVPPRRHFFFRWDQRRQDLFSGMICSEDLQETMVSSIQHGGFRLEHGIAMVWLRFNFNNIS